MSPRRTAFSLAETVIALGICTFCLMAILGMFARGLESQRSASGTLRAAQLASLVLAERTAGPTNTTLACVLPALNRPFDGSLQSKLIGWDGAETNANAAFRVAYQAGTNSTTGTRLAQVRLALSWPPEAEATNATVGRYEISTLIPLY